MDNMISMTGIRSSISNPAVTEMSLGQPVPLGDGMGTRQISHSEMATGYIEYPIVILHKYLSDTNGYDTCKNRAVYEEINTHTIYLNF